MATERIKLFEADIDVDGIIKKSGELKQAMNDAKDAMIIARLQTGETSKEYIIAEASVKKLSSEYRINQQQIINLTADGGKMLTVQQKLTMSIDKEVKSIENAVDNNKELRKIRNSVNAETIEGQKAITDLNKKIDENTAFIKANTDSFSQQKMQIGDYKNQIKEAYGELNIFNGGFSGFIQRAEKAGGVMPLVKNGLVGITQGIWGATKASVAFILTPIGAVIATIGLVVGALVGYLKGTQEGMDKVTAVTRPLMAIMESLKGVLQSVGETMFKALSSPKKLLTDLVDFIKNNVINRFKAFGVILEAIENRDWKGLRNGIAQAATGIENLEDKIINGAKATADFLKDAAAKGAEIDRLQKEIEKGEADMILRRSEINKAMLEQETISKNQLLSDDKRAAAIKKQTELAYKLVDAEQAILDKKILQEEIQQSLSDSGRKDLTKLNELLAERNDKENVLTETKKKNLGAEKQLYTESANNAKKAQQEREAIDKKAIDDAIRMQEQSLSLLKEQRKFDEDNLDKIKFFADEELKVLKKKLDSKIITTLEYQIEKQKIDNSVREAEIESENAEIERVKEFNERKDQIENEIELRRLEVKSERDLLKAEQDFEKKVLELENLQLNEQEKTELLALMEMDRQQIIDGIKAEGMQKQLDDYKAFSDKEIAQRQSNANEVAAIASQLTSILSGLLGDSIGAKLASLAIDAAIQAGMVSTTTAASQAMNLAQATATLPPPLNAPLIAAAGVQNAVLQANSTKAISKIIAGAAIKGIGTVAGSMRKAEHGMAIDIGGQRHSSGGTKFFGEDGTNFEAEKGEKMFILNRRASAALGPLLSDINMQYGGASLSSPASYLAAGGQVIRGSQAAAANNNIDFERMEEIMFRGTSRGSEVGSSKGSAKGTYSGIVDREDNIKIAAGANF